VDRVPDPLLLRKSGSTGNRSVARNPDHRRKNLKFTVFVHVRYSSGQATGWTWRYSGGSPRRLICTMLRPAVDSAQPLVRRVWRGRAAVTSEPAFFCLVTPILQPGWQVQTTSFVGCISYTRWFFVIAHRKFFYLYLLAIKIMYILWANLQAKTLSSCAYVMTRSSPVRGPFQPSISSTGQDFF
jgi:hypothetical protein